MDNLLPNSFQVNNFYVDHCLHLLTGDETKILLFAIRKIIGFQKESDFISLSQFVRATGLNRATVVKNLESLKSFGLLVQLPSNGQGSCFALQLEFKEINLSKLQERSEQKAIKNISKFANLGREMDETGLSRKPVQEINRFKPCTSLSDKPVKNDLIDNKEINNIENLTGLSRKPVYAVNTQKEDIREEVREEEEIRIRSKREESQTLFVRSAQENLFPSQNDFAGEKSAPILPPKKQQKTKEVDSRFSHPGLVAIREIISSAGSKEFPAKLVWDDLIAALGETPDIAKLQQCAKAWLLKGYRIGNFAWVTDWYKNGLPLGQHKQEEKSLDPKSINPAEIDIQTVQDMSLTERFKQNRQEFIDFLVSLPVEKVRYYENNALTKAERDSLPEAHRNAYNRDREYGLRNIKIYAPQRYQQALNY